MQLPFTNKFFIESKVYFHGFDQMTQPGTYRAAKAIVSEDKLVELEVNTGIE